MTSNYLRRKVLVLLWSWKDCCPKQKNTSISLQAKQKLVTNHEWFDCQTRSQAYLTLDNLTTHVQTTLHHAVKAPPVTIFRYNGGFPLHFTSVLSFWKSCRGKLKKALQWWKAGTFVDMAGTDWQHFVFPVLLFHFSLWAFIFAATWLWFNNTNKHTGSHILFKNCERIISQDVSL